MIIFGRIYAFVCTWIDKLMLHFALSKFPNVHAMTVQCNFPDPCLQLYVSIALAAAMRFLVDPLEDLSSGLWDFPDVLSFHDLSTTITSFGRGCLFSGGGRPPRLVFGSVDGKSDW